MTAYYTPPPQVKSLPKFMYKHYPEQIYTSLVAWADNEYKTALLDSTRKGRTRVVKVLSDEWSGMRVLSQMDGFRWICSQLDEATWNKLDRKTRKFIRKAYEMYELLRT